MTSILIKKQVGGLRIFSLVRGGSEVKCLRATGLQRCPKVTVQFYLHLYTRWSYIFTPHMSSLHSA
jgi:hypothetical protein